MCSNPDSRQCQTLLSQRISFYIQIFFILIYPFFLFVKFLLCAITPPVTTPRLLPLHIEGSVWTHQEVPSRCLDLATAGSQTGSVLLSQEIIMHKFSVIFVRSICICGCHVCDLAVMLLLHPQMLHYLKQKWVILFPGLLIGPIKQSFFHL